MLLNVSYTDKTVTQKIDTALGKPFTLKERWQMGGIGSPKLAIRAASIQIQNLLNLDHNTNYCNIEIRPKGIIVGFRSLLETYALIIPYYKLTLYKGDLATYTMYRDNYYLKVRTDTKAAQKFFKKLLDHRADMTPTPIEDL